MTLWDASGRRCRQISADSQTITYYKFNKATPPSDLAEELQRVEAAATAPGRGTHPAFILLGLWFAFPGAYFGLRRWSASLDRQLRDRGISVDEG